MISFLKCPFVPTFLLIIYYIARRYDQKKTETFSLKDPFAWEFFVHLLSLISVSTTEGHM